MSKCTDCNEYNQEKHYCPKFCDVIRDTTTEMQEFYKGEHEKLERIEQIVASWNNDASHSFGDMCKINKILKE